VPEIVQAEAVAVRYLKLCRFCGWPEVIGDEYGRRYGNPAVCLSGRKSLSFARDKISMNRL